MVWITLPCELDKNEKQWMRHYPNFQHSQMQAMQENSFLDFKCLLNVESTPHQIYRATNIACYVDQIRNDDLKSLKEMMENGMNIARIDTTNLSNDYKHYSKIIQNIRQAAKNYSERLGQNFPIGIGIDTLGQTIRTGFIKGGEHKEVELMTGAIVKLTTDLGYLYKCTAYVIYLNIENIFSSIAPGQIIYIDDELIKLTCQSIAGIFITCKVDVGGVLGSQKEVHLPEINFMSPIVSEFDKTILDFAIKQRVDFIFCAVIANADAVIEIRKILGEQGKNIKIISKIETQGGLRNLPDIIDVSDGILIGRGNLALKVSIQKLAIAQKYIIAMCNKVGCPVIVARQLMDTMQFKRLPTLADVSDVANAIEDGADILMLSSEIMLTNQRNSVIRTVSQICKEAEAIQWRSSYDEWAFLSDEEKILVNTLAQTVVSSSINAGAAAIFVITENGETAEIISKYRPRCPVLAITRNIRVAKQCNLHRSIIPFLCDVPVKSDQHKDIDAQIDAGLNFGKKRNFIHPNDPIVVFVGNIKNNIYKNSMLILYAEENLEIIHDVLFIK